MKRLFTLMLMAVVALAITVPMNAQKKRKSTAAKPAVNIVAKPDPTQDMDAPWNTNGESLKEFIEKWIASSDFRKERSANVAMCFAIDPDLGTYETNTAMFDSGDLYDMIVGPITDEEWKNIMSPHEKTKKRGSRVVETETCLWESVKPDFAYYSINVDDQECGSAIFIVFTRINGKWQLVGLNAAG